MNITCAPKHGDKGAVRRQQTKNRPNGPTFAKFAMPRCTASAPAFGEHGDHRASLFAAPTIRSTCARESRNCRARAAGLTPASNAARKILA